MDFPMAVEIPATLHFLLIKGKRQATRMGEESNLILEQRPDSNAGRIILSRQSDTTGRCLDSLFHPLMLPANHANTRE